VEVGVQIRVQIDLYEEFSSLSQRVIGRRPRTFDSWKSDEAKTNFLNIVYDPPLSKHETFALLQALIEFFKLMGLDARTDVAHL